MKYLVRVIKYFVYITVVMALILLALSLLGIISDDFVASPFYKFEAPEREKIRQALDNLPIKGGKLCI